MEQNKVKIKYLLNLWKALPSYPTQEDILYEISFYLEKDGRENAEFSQSTLDFIFRNATVEEQKNIDIRLETLKGNDDIIKTKETGEGKEWWKIKTNPFYKNKI